MPAPDPTAVPCPDCLAPTGTPCTITNPRITGAHAGRRDRAKQRAIYATLTAGTCRLCSRRLLQVTDPETGTPVDTWHPADGSGTICPPEPLMSPYDAPGWVQFFNAGLQSNRPGHAHFVPEDTHVEAG